VNVCVSRSMLPILRMLRSEGAITIAAVTRSLNERKMQTPMARAGPSQAWQAALAGGLSGTNYASRMAKGKTPTTAAQYRKRADERARA